MRAQKPKHYRPDIDGLRAIAVLAVVGFHAEIAVFSAGFAGVDVFFVISGFLITGLILEALEKDTFTFRDFYARRANRILPALLVVLVATIVIGWCILYSWELKQLGRHVTASAVFATNFALWSEAGYFDSWLKPLLHLWSLAVEEQFYIIWPIATVAMWKRKVAFTWPLIVVLFLSFAFSLAALSTGYGTTAFFFPVSRFWEIGVGALLAVRIRRTREEQSDAASELTALLGVALLALTFIFVNRKTLWPGWWAVPPVAGTAFLILAGPATRINRLLSNKVLVGVGLISYPLYLWHFPLFVFAKLVNETQLSRPARVGLIPLSFLLAWITYRFVEIPIRFGARKRRSAVILVCGLAIIGLTGASLATVVRPRLNSESAARADSARFDWVYPQHQLEGASRELTLNTLDGDTTRTVVFIGDSHLEQYWPRFVELHRIEHDGPRVVFITYGGCPMLPDVNRTDLTRKGSRFRCPEFFVKALAAAMRPSVKTVVIGSYWEDHFVRNDIVSTRTNKVLTRFSPEADSALNGLKKSLEMLRGREKRVILILSNPVAAAYRPDSIYPHRRLPWLPEPSPVEFVSRKVIENSLSYPGLQLRAIARETGVETIDPVEYMCDAEKCPVKTPDGNPIYIDNNHFRASYARKHVTFLDQVLRR